jgi:putative transposase
MKSKEKDYSMEEVYKVNGSSRQAQAQSVRRNIAEHDIEKDVVKLVKEHRIRHPGLSARQLYHTIKNQNIKIQVGINKFEKIVSEHGLNIRDRKRNRPRTSDGKGKGDYSNLTYGLEINDINQLIVSDITYYWVEDKWYYLFTLKDVYSQRIIELIPSNSLSAESCMRCLESLKKLRAMSDLKGCVHHTDNGSQYAFGDYIKELKGLEMLISRAKNCKENGSAEHLNSIIKNTYLNGWNIKSFADLVKGSNLVKKYNNEERAIVGLGNISPIQYEELIKKIPLSERQVKTMYDFRKWQM